MRNPSGTERGEDVLGGLWVGTPRIDAHDADVGQGHALDEFGAPGTVSILNTRVPVLTLKPSHSHCVRPIAEMITFGEKKLWLKQPRSYP